MFFRSISRLSLRRFLGPLRATYNARPLTNNANFIEEREYRADDKKLFTPGPICVSTSVKAAMLQDVGSRDPEFINAFKFVQRELLNIANVDPEEFTAVCIQGSGTYTIEAIMQTTVHWTTGRVLVLEGGAYGKRIGKICDTIGLPYKIESFPDTERIDPHRVAEILQADKSFTHLAVVHHETSTGVVNHIDEIGQAAKAVIPSLVYVVDAMSSFGAMPIDFKACKIDYLASSMNKCLESVPGFAFVICRRSHLETCSQQSRSLVMDLYDQHVAFDKTGQFRFTPPTHVILAAKQAIIDFEAHRYVAGRAARYKRNREVLRIGMRRLGFSELLDDSHAEDSYIITTFFYPDDPNFDFNEFYQRLHVRGQVIYPGKVSDRDCFRIGNIGYLFPDDMKTLLICIEDVCREMNVKLPKVPPKDDELEHH